MPKKLLLTDDERKRRQDEQARLRMQKMRAKNRLQAPNPSPSSYGYVTQPAVGPITAAPVTPAVTSPTGVNLSLLAKAASVAENGLDVCAKMLGVTELDIQQAIAPLDWLTYHTTHVVASDGRKRAALNSKAEQGDIKALELQQKPNDVLTSEYDKRAGERARALEAMTMEQLDARIAELNAALGRSEPLISPDYLSVKNPDKKFVKVTDRFNEAYCQGKIRADGSHTNQANAALAAEIAAEQKAYEAEQATTEIPGDIQL